MMHSKRIQKEIADLRKSSNSDIITIEPQPGNDLSKWTGTLLKPPEPYSGGIYKLKITIPPDYPFKPPHIVFDTPIFHPNISQDGIICVDILKNNWSPALTLERIMLSIMMLLETPNPDDPLDAGAASLYKRNREEYNKRVKEHVSKYAKE